MIAIRRVARREPPMSRNDFIKQLATELGYRRVSSNIRTHLSGHLRAAVRRDILQSYRGEVESWKTTITDFTNDDLRRALISVTRRTTYDRTDLMRTIARTSASPVSPPPSAPA